MESTVKILRWLSIALLGLTVFWILQGFTEPIVNYDLKAPFVGFSYWGGPVLFTQPTKVLNYLGIFAHILSAGLLGHSLFLKYLIQRSDQRAQCFPPFQNQKPDQWKSWLILGVYGLACFVPGYLIGIAIARLVTLILPNGPAFIGLKIFDLGVIAYSFYRWLRAPGKTLGQSLSFLFIVLFAVTLALIHQIQNGNTHAVGDSTSYALSIYADETQIKYLVGPNEKFPIFTQHYDEVMFLAPLLQDQVKSGGDLLVPFWVLGGLGKISCFALAIMLFFQLTGSLRFSSILSLFIFFGAYFIDIEQGFLIFDSGNPAAYLLHIGRLISILLPILAFVQINRWSELDQEPSSRVDHLFRLGNFLFGLGLASTTISNEVYFGVIFLLLLWKFIQSQSWRFPSIGTDTSILLFMGSVLLFPIAIYSNFERGLGISLVFVVLLWVLTGVQICSIRSSEQIFETSKAGYRNWAMGALVGATAIGFLFLGNLFILKFGWMNGFTLFERKTAPLLQNHSVGWGASKFCHQWPLLHCAGFGAFASRFGFSLLLAVWVMGVMLWQRSRNSIDRVKADQSILILSILMAFLFSTVVIYDYTNPESNSWIDVWVKSRLVEPWFYTLLIASWMMLFQSAPRFRPWIHGVMLGYVMLPQVFHFQDGLFAQWIDNIKFLIR